MRSRAFNKRIDIYELLAVADGYGGTTFTNQIVLSTWAKIDTFKSGSKDNTDTDFGTLSTESGVIITIRNRKDLRLNSTNNFILYRGNKYIISTNPTNVQFKDNIVQFIGVREQIEQPLPIGDNTEFTYIFPFNLA
jgi:head-tail adaptor